MEHRTGESGLVPFRTRRVFNIGTKWFFAIRGGKDCGPFENQVDAEFGLNAYLMSIETNQKMRVNEYRI